MGQRHKQKYSKKLQDYDIEVVLLADDRDGLICDCDFIMKSKEGKHTYHLTNFEEADEMEAYFMNELNTFDVDRLLIEYNERLEEVHTEIEERIKPLREKQKQIRKEAEAYVNKNLIRWVKELDK